MTSERRLGYLLLAIGMPSVLVGVYLTAISGEFDALLLTGLGANTVGVLLLEESETNSGEASDEVATE